MERRYIEKIGISKKGSVNLHRVKFVYDSDWGRSENILEYYSQPLKYSASRVWGDLLSGKPYEVKGVVDEENVLFWAPDTHHFMIVRATNGDFKREPKAFLTISRVRGPHPRINIFPGHGQEDHSRSVRLLANYVDRNIKADRENFNMTVNSYKEIFHGTLIDYRTRTK